MSNVHTLSLPTTGGMVVRAQPEHIDDALDWLRARGMAVPPRDVFTSTGYVLPGVAAVWLYLTDSSLAFLDFLIANPALGRGARSAGLDEVLAAAISEAKASGTRLLFAVTERADVEKRGARHGFSLLGRGVSMIGLNFNSDAGPSVAGTPKETAT